jgi:D-glycero-D-manno-heptose 1,7-bisphosphate phosphatase
LKRLLDAGWGICVLTNQAGVGRGLFDRQKLDQVHQRLEDMLADFGVQVDGIFLCPHDPGEQCSCRKPAPGLVHQAMAEHKFNPRQAWVIGDKETDVALGHAVGAKSILVRTGYGKDYEPVTHATYVVDDLSAAVDLILDGKE